MTRVTIPQPPFLARSRAVSVTLVLDATSPAFVLHAAKHTMLAVASAEALIVADALPSTLSALSDSAVVCATSLVAVSPSVHVHMTTRLLEYAPPPTPLQQRVTLVPLTPLPSTPAHPALAALSARTGQKHLIA